MDFNGKKVAVARFSRPGMNWVSGSIVPLKVGNTAKLADVIAEETGGSVYAIEPAAAYPDDYRACTDQAAKLLDLVMVTVVEWVIFGNDACCFDWGHDFRILSVLRRNCSTG